MLPFMTQHCPFSFVFHPFFLMEINCEEFLILFALLSIVKKLLAPSGICRLKRDTTWGYSN